MLYIFCLTGIATAAKVAKKMIAWRARPLRRLRTRMYWIMWVVLGGGGQLAAALNEGHKEARLSWSCLSYKCHINASRNFIFFFLRHLSGRRVVPHGGSRASCLLPKGFRTREYCDALKKLGCFYWHLIGIWAYWVLVEIIFRFH